VQGAYVEAASSTSTANATAQNLGSSAQVTITPASTTPTPTQNTPAITWSTPAPIPYGTALSMFQLNATANVPGSFVYTPAAGTVLQPGSQTLSTTFTPTDTATYAAATSTVQLTVTPPTVCANHSGDHLASTGRRSARDRPQRCAIECHRECGGHPSPTIPRGHRSRAGHTTTDGHVHTVRHDHVFVGNGAQLTHHYRHFVWRSGRLNRLGVES